MVSSELLKEQAELEADDAKKQLSDMTNKLEDTKKSPVQELCKMSPESHTMLESELEVVHKHGSPDSADKFNHTCTDWDELHNLQSKHEKTVSMVEKLMVEVGECKKSEAQVVEELNNSRSELEESNSKVNVLEILVSELQSNLVTYDTLFCQETVHDEEMEKLKSEILNLKYEDCKLRSALEAAEMRYLELRLQSTLDIRSAYEQVESTNLILRSKVAEMQKANSHIAELQAKLADSETRSQTHAERNEQKQLEIRFTALQERLSEKDMLLRGIEEENESLKQRLMEAIDGSGAGKLVEARAAEQKAISKFECLTEESDKNSKRTARVIEQLAATQAANTELESELRKLKVQSDQWRKAAEAAATMLTSGNNGKYKDRTGSLHNGYHSLGGRVSSPFSDDLCDVAVKKKNVNMLKKIGVLWNKGQNQK